MSAPPSRSPSSQWYPQEQPGHHRSPQPPLQQQPSQQWAPLPPPQQQWSPSTDSTTAINYHNPNANMPNHNSSQVLLGATSAPSVSSMPPTFSPQLGGNQFQMPHGVPPPPPPGGMPTAGLMMPGVPPPVGGLCSGCCAAIGCCCGGPQTQGCCSQMPGEPLEPYVCPEPMFPGQQRQCECITSCNCTFWMMCIMFIVSLLGFIIVLASSSTDNIFAAFDVDNTTLLQERITPFIKWMNMCSASSAALPGVYDSTGEKVQFLGDKISTSVYECQTLLVPESCTYSRLTGSFGGVCMENSLNANVFAVQLSQWNNARNTLYFTAFVFTLVAIVLSVLVSRQRQSATAPPSMPVQLPQDKQDELNRLPPVQQQLFLMEYMSNNPQYYMKMQQQQQAAGCCSFCVEVYDTPFYEFMRIAWFYLGMVALFWSANLLLSYWSFSSFYKEETTGQLKEFWEKYDTKFSASVILVTIYLAWPLFNVFLDLAVLVIGIIPWVIIRSTCKEGVGRYRPSLPLSQLPGWIRTDMFFMDFQDMKRLGFSRAAWILLTGAPKPFFECCEDTTVDTDPNMTALVEARAQYERNCYNMMMAGWQLPGMAMVTPPQPQAPEVPPTLASGQALEETAGHSRRRHRRSHGMSDETGGATGRHHRSRSKRHSSSRHRRSRSRSRHAPEGEDPVAADGNQEASIVVVPPEEGGSPSRSRHRQHGSLTRGAGEAGAEAGREAPRSRSHHRRRRSEAKGAAEAGAENGGETHRSRSRRHRQSLNVSKESPGEGGSRVHRRRQSRDYRDRKESKSKVVDDLDELMNL